MPVRSACAEAKRGVPIRTAAATSTTTEMRCIWPSPSSSRTCDANLKRGHCALSMRADRDDEYQRCESQGLAGPTGQPGLPALSRDRVAIAQDAEMVPDVAGHHIGQRTDGDRLVVALSARLPLRLLEAA